MLMQQLNGQNNAAQAAAAALAATKNGTSESTSTSSGSSSVKVTQAVIDLADQCGQDVPHTKDALMLMIKECQTQES
jgi:hypothetical protein